MMSSVLSAFAALALAGDPQCFAKYDSCAYTFANGTFGNAWSEAREGKSLNEEERAAVCVRKNMDNNFQPNRPDAHLDQKHPLHGKEFQIVAPGADGETTTRGCKSSDFADGDYAGKIALVQRGGCSFVTKFYYAEKAGATMGVVINNRNEERMGDGLASMSGNSKYVSMPALWMVKQYTPVLLDALADGAEIYGKFELTCTAGLREPTAEEMALSDECHTGELEKSCLDAPRDEDRLCAACPLAMRVGDVEGCLRGNALMPRRAATMMQHSKDFDALPFPDVVHWMVDMPETGCSVESFAGLAGQIVVAKYPTKCTSFEAAYRAHTAGVRAFVQYVPPGDTHWLTEGPSEPVGIPVHVISGDEAVALGEAVRAAGTALTLESGATGFTVSALFKVGKTLPRPPAENVTRVAGVAEVPRSTEPDWKWTPGAIVAVLLVIAASAGVAGVYVRQRANTVSLPPVDGGADALSVPLGLANMGISVTLTTVISVVAFALATSAGMEATDTAAQDGRAAVDEVYRNARDNANELALSLRRAVVGDVTTGVQKLISEGESVAKGVAVLFMGYEGDFSSFKAMYDSFVSYDRKGGTSYRARVITTEGFYASREFITDYRTDEEREDGVNGSVWETNNGFLYGIAKMKYSSRSFVNSFHAGYSRLAWEAPLLVGGRPGDPLAIARGKARGFAKWHVTKRAFPNLEDSPRQPISVFTPLYDRQDNFRGVVEARCHLTSWGTALRKLATGRMQNLTLVIVDPSDRTVLATNAWYNIKGVGEVVRNRETVIRHSYTLDDLPAVEVSAATRYVDSFPGDAWDTNAASGEFDQHEWYAPMPLTVFRIRAGSDGHPVDVGGDAWDAEVHGACGSCVDGDGNFDFDGSTMMYIKRNLTTRASVVADSKVPTADGSWASSLPEFSLIHDNGGDPCIALNYTENDDRTGEGATMTCMLRQNFQHGDGYGGEGYTVSLRVKPRVAYHDVPMSRMPVLFTDAVAGDPNVRLYANGQLNMWVSSYGCQVAPPTGGIPVGQWTTVTVARTSTGAPPSVCRVFMNGTLVGEGEISKDFYVSGSRSPYVVGMNYDGLIGGVDAYNVSAGVHEASAIHNSGVLSQPVPSREWYVDLEDISQDSNSRSGTGWLVMSLLPKSDVLRAVHENNRITTRNLEIQEHNANKRRTQKENETIMIVLAVVLLSVLIFLMFNDALTTPFAKTALVMTDAAVMRIEQVPVRHSLLSELNTMNRAMALMCANLKEYKSYMPQTLGLDDEDDEDEEEFSEQASKCSVAKSSMSGSMSRSHSHVSSVAVQAQEKRRGLDLSLTKKKVSFCVTNVEGWFHGTQSLGDRAMLELHSDILSIAMEAFAANNGISEVFSGDRFVASFNAVKTCSVHRTACVEAAHKVCADFMARHGSNFNIHAACASGEARVGNCGNDLMKKYSFMSPVLTWCYGLERLARTIGLRLLADMYAYQEAANSFYKLITLDVVFMKRNKSGPIRVAEMRERKAAGDCDEWMYELEKADKGDPYSAVNSFAEAVMDGQWEEAGKFAQVAEKDHPETYARLNEQYEQRVAQPLHLMYH